MSTQTLDHVQEALQTGKPTMSHIVGPKDGVDGVVICMEARLHSLPVTALCGYTWVPSTDPRSVPSCDTCEAIFVGKFGPDGCPSEA